MTVTGRKRTKIAELGRESFLGWGAGSSELVILRLGVNDAPHTQPPTHPGMPLAQLLALAAELEQSQECSVLSLPRYVY